MNMVLPPMSVSSDVLVNTVTLDEFPSREDLEAGKEILGFRVLKSRVLRPGVVVVMSEKHEPWRLEVSMPPDGCVPVDDEKEER